MQMKFSQSKAYLNGVWQEQHELAWSVTDLGTTQGAILVERLRTLGGKLFAVDDHLMRLSEGAEKLGIPWPISEGGPSREGVMRDLCFELVERNRAFVESERDVGLVLLISPGDPGIDRTQSIQPTIMAHISPLPFAQLSKWYQHGSALHFSMTRNVPAESWSPSIKTRSRLQYYLADRDLAGCVEYDVLQSKLVETTRSRAADSVAVLLGTRNNVTETSISNLIVLGKDGILRSPPLTDILWGISLKTVCELSESTDRKIQFSEITPEHLFDANEILMTGSTGCLWSAVTIDGQAIGDGRPGPVCALLQKAWQEKIGFSFVEQATQRNH